MPTEKQAHKKNARIWDTIYTWLTKHLFLSTFVAGILYLTFFQFRFVSTGDSWAEAFYEYVHGAVTGTTGDFFFSQGIAGYFEFIPRFLTLLYTHSGLPLGHIDQFFRISVIVFVVACSSYIAHKHNRYLIKNDALRIALALLTLMTYYHITSFSFINAWYIGFIPVILVSLNPEPIRRQQHQVAYAIFCMAVFLTKPSMIILPLVLYRTVKLKEYLLGFILVFAIGLQSLIFFTSDFYIHASSSTPHVDILTRAIDTVLYIGLLALKLFRIPPPNLVVVIATCAILVGLLWFSTKLLGFIRTGLIALTGILSSYTAIYAPDTYPPLVHSQYKVLFYDQFKLQREVLLSFLILFLIFISVYYLSQRLTPKSRLIIVTVATIVMAIGIFRHIDTSSPGLYVDITPFRQTLTAQTPLCMPVAPTPAWGDLRAPAYPWYYENGKYGTCERTNYDKIISYASTTSMGSGIQIDTTTPEGVRSPSAMLLPITNASKNSAQLVLEDLSSRRTFTAHLIKNQPLVFVAFNLTGDVPGSYHTFLLKQAGTSNSSLQVSHFADTNDIAEFTYYVEVGSKE